MKLTVLTQIMDLKQLRDEAASFLAAISQITETSELIVDLDGEEYAVPIDTATDILAAARKHATETQQSAEKELAALGVELDIEAGLTDDDTSAP